MSAPKAYLVALTELVSATESVLAPQGAVHEVLHVIQTNLPLIASLIDLIACGGCTDDVAEVIKAGLVEASDTEMRREFPR